jgi:transposase
MSRIATGITMSMRELDRLKTVQPVVDRMLRVGQAAEGLGISCRQVERLVKRYEAGGAAGLVSAKRGRPSNNQLSDGVAGRALALIQQRYPDFGPTLACEKLRELHALAVS